MKLRAKQDTSILTPLGNKWVAGPQVSDDDKQLSQGEEVLVDDDFVVNPQVWDVVTPPAGGKPVEFVEFDEDGTPKKRAPKKAAADDSTPKKPAADKQKAGASA
jgi:hypothetical protein